MVDFFDEALGFLIDVTNDCLNEIVELTRWMLTGLLVLALEGHHLTPGGDDNAGERLEALVASYQPEAPPDNSWSAFTKLCDAFGEVSLRSYERQLEVVNKSRAATGLPALALDSKEFDFTADQITRPHATLAQHAFAQTFRR